MNYSVTFAGLIGALLLPLLGQWGFSEACSNEIMGIGVPYFLSIPGLLVAAIGRWRHGDITPFGSYKRTK